MFVKLSLESYCVDVLHYCGLDGVETVTVELFGTDYIPF